MGYKERLALDRLSSFEDFFKGVYWSCENLRFNKNIESLADAKLLNNKNIQTD